MTAFIWISLLIVIISMVGLLYRIFRGPSVPDRLVALDAIGVMFISATALLSVLFETELFLDVILLLAVLSFIGTVSFSKFIEKGEIIERDRNS
ncbi:Na(+)/H(+) antiporter subunit F1 [Sporosarcina sp. Marseille-Q4063]|uniref:Na(+)/H(+) antiporter subunit F1 n=1 Tax=Sporosarcina sp. Marseille-Q4063 TaxID=2810514 RepID=UPI001BAFC36E|nr:Na(+)/H(+) antiporter subunit F1 [Sporosarcina sp. Marseille-Q4063]QUW23243.1 Na(+)/H(+) antiporter subunit F1 [Sporosarcina sp. Marseille-Q4063]